MNSFGFNEKSEKADCFRLFGGEKIIRWINRWHLFTERIRVHAEVAMCESLSSWIPGLRHGRFGVMAAGEEALPENPFVSYHSPPVGSRSRRNFLWRFWLE